MLEEPTEPLTAHDRPIGKAVCNCFAAIRNRKRHVAPTLVRALFVIMFEELLAEVLQVRLAQDNEGVETLGFYT